MGSGQQKINLPLLHVEYRLVPEHPLPAAVEDVMAVYNALLTQDSSVNKRIIGMGDSAGGGLLLLTLQAIISKHLPIPLAAVPISPWTDLSYSGDSYTRNRDLDVMVKYDSFQWGVELVLGGSALIKSKNIQPNDPIYSPLFGSFKKFPPMYIVVGTAELLESDARSVYEKAKAEKVEVTLEAGEHMMHVYPMFGLYYPEATQAMNRINTWLNEQFKS
ncbi:unnamed protein product [Didymodactylos carnosus]|uniref:Alpha/beta hydrolase fold-3 domain-containing protein n=1 Tax=Didymodactylos carnosus TaxID=1234261 RepID=A0A8S2E7Z9_9BILA|nr:unnamed protein product [Didymodactylos carnosus]CAF3968087.1 unnamed protein product [Didymodactylos carnosus]